MEGLLLRSDLEGFSRRGVTLLRFQMVELRSRILSEPRNRTFVHIIVISSQIFLRRTLLQLLLLVKALIRLIQVIEVLLFHVVCLIKERIGWLEGLGCACFLV